MRSRNENKAGYTFIELLVVITVSVIVFGIGFAGYREFSRRQDLTGVSKNLIGDLRLIQQLSLTGQKPEGATCTKLIGYTFTRVSATNYSMTANCDNSGIISNVEIKNVDFPTGVSFTATTANTQFKVLGQGTNLSASNTLTLTNSLSGSSNEITIGIGGDIR